MKTKIGRRIFLMIFLFVVTTFIYSMFVTSTIKAEEIYTSKEDAFSALGITKTYLSDDYQHIYFFKYLQDGKEKYTVIGSNTTPVFNVDVVSNWITVVYTGGFIQGLVGGDPLVYSSSEQSNHSEYVPYNYCKIVYADETVYSTVNGQLTDIKLFEPVGNDAIFPQEYLEKNYNFTEPYYVYGTVMNMPTFICSHTPFYADTNGFIHTSSKPNYLSQKWTLGVDGIWHKDLFSGTSTNMRINIADVLYNNDFVHDSNISSDNKDDFVPVGLNSVTRNATGSLAINTIKHIPALEEATTLYNTVYNKNLPTIEGVSLVKAPLVTNYGVEIGKSHDFYKLQWSPITEDGHYIEVAFKLSRNDSEDTRIIMWQEYNSPKYYTQEEYLDKTKGVEQFNISSMAEKFSKYAWEDYQNAEDVRISKIFVREVVLSESNNQAQYGSWVVLSLGYNELGEVKEIISNQEHEQLVQNPDGSVGSEIIKDSDDVKEVFDSNGNLLSNDSVTTAYYGLDNAITDSIKVMNKIPEWTEGYVQLLTLLFPAFPPEISSLILFAVVTAIILRIAGR
jgi:ribosomal protein S8